MIFSHFVLSTEAIKCKKCIKISLTFRLYVTSLHILLDSVLSCSLTLLQIFLWIGILDTSTNTSFLPEAHLAIMRPFHSPSTFRRGFLLPGGKTSAITCEKMAALINCQINAQRFEKLSTYLRYPRPFTSRYEMTNNVSGAL